MEKTFKDLGLVFEYDQYCQSCGNGGCHNVVRSKKDGQEYSVHIGINSDYTLFTISASKEANTSSDSDIDKEFDNEAEAVEFLEKTFENFHCF